MERVGGPAISPPADEPKQDEEPKPVLPEVLVLPSGGKVWFRDIEELNGRDFKDIRAAFNYGAMHASEGDNRLTYQRAAAIFVTRWEIPGLPNLPLPGSPEGGEGQITDMLRWRDCRALDTVLGEAIVYMRMGVTDGDTDIPLRSTAG